MSNSCSKLTERVYSTTRGRLRAALVQIELLVSRGREPRRGARRRSASRRDAVDRDHRSRRCLRHGPRARQSARARRALDLRRAAHRRAAGASVGELAAASRRAARPRTGLGRRHRRAAAGDSGHRPARSHQTRGVAPTAVGSATRGTRACYCRRRALFCSRPIARVGRTWCGSSPPAGVAAIKANRSSIGQKCARSTAGGSSPVRTTCSIDDARSGIGLHCSPICATPTAMGSTRSARAIAKPTTCRVKLACARARKRHSCRSSLPPKCSITRVVAGRCKTC